MTFAEFLTSFYALSLDAAGQTRAKRMLNESLAELASLQPWPFLETTTLGATELRDH